MSKRAYLFSRLIFYDRSSDRLVPTCVILIAPPVMDFIARIKLAGEMDAFARAPLTHDAIIRLPAIDADRRMCAVALFLSCWIYSLPLAALTVATTLVSQMLHSFWFTWRSIPLFSTGSRMLILPILKTVWAVANRQICIEEG